MDLKIDEQINPEKSINFFQKLFFHRFRYFIIFLGFFCLTSVNSNYVTYNFTLICFKKNSTKNNEDYNIPQYDLTENEETMLMWAVAVGAIIGTFPFNFLYNKFGAKFVFFAAGIVSAISTFMIPFSANWGISYFVILRVIQGIAYSADFAALGIMCVRWASLKQSAFFVSVLTCFSPFAAVITNPVSGELCQSKWGWPSVYYVHGVACFILFILWIIFYSDDPKTHKAVSEIELEKIHRDKTEAHKNMTSSVPYMKICKNPVILAVWLNAMVDLVSGILLLTYTPRYFDEVLNYNIKKIGWFGALPPLLHIPFKFFCGFLSDKITSVPERKKLIIFNSIALIGPAILYALLGFVPDDYPNIAVILFIIINTCIGANGGGFYKCGVLVSRQYSAFVIGSIQFIKCLTLFVCPGLVYIFVSKPSTRDQWRIIFIILSVSCILSNLIFCYFATEIPADFTNQPLESDPESSESDEIVIKTKNKIHKS